MPQVIEKTVFQFSELSGPAQERAKHWWISCMDVQDFDFVVEDFERVCEILGVTLETRSVRTWDGKTRQEPCVYWSGFCSQGDGASFSGRYSYAKGSCKAIRAYAPDDDTLHGIAARLAAIQKPYSYGLSAKITHSGPYQHSGCMRLDWCEDRRGEYPEYSVQDAIRDELRALADWLYQQLLAENEYRTSDEAIEAAMDANEYTFDENGHREG